MFIYLFISVQQGLILYFKYKKVELVGLLLSCWECGRQSQSRATWIKNFFQTHADDVVELPLSDLANLKWFYAEYRDAQKIFKQYTIKLQGKTGHMII